MLKVQSIKMDGKLNEHLKKVSAIRAQARAGFFRNSKYPDGTFVAVVAFQNETGANNVPRRPFMHRTLKDNQEKYVKGICANIKRFGRFDEDSVRSAYETCAQLMEGDIKRTIMDWLPSDPRFNSPATIAEKRERGVENPERALVDTGTMVGKVAHEVII